MGGSLVGCWREKKGPRRALFFVIVVRGGGGGLRNEVHVVFRRSRDES